MPLRRRLRIEPLEDRRLLSITVNTLVDELDGSILDGDISLRDAIAAAPSGETINFAVDRHDQSDTRPTIDQPESHDQRSGGQSLDDRR